jgi:hypothetical protein
VDSLEELVPRGEEQAEVTMDLHASKAAAVAAHKHSASKSTKGEKKSSTLPNIILYTVDDMGCVSPLAW